MSWNKNTINVSDLDSTIEVLENLDVPYKCETIGRVQGYGLNDSYGFSDDEDKFYDIRKLSYGDWIVIEQIVRDIDCDANDLIVSKKFKKGEVPEDWKIEEVFGYEDEIDV
jgi:hypothetical protein